MKQKVYLYNNVLTKDNLNNFTTCIVSKPLLNLQHILEPVVDIIETCNQLFLKKMLYQLCDDYSINKINSVQVHNSTSLQYYV